jgi:hypothetical protein
LRIAYRATPAQFVKLRLALGVQHHKLAVDRDVAQLAKIGGNLWELAEKIIASAREHARTVAVLYEQRPVTVMLQLPYAGRVVERLGVRRRRRQVTMRLSLRLF